MNKKNNSPLHLHIELMNLPDGTYVLVPEAEEEPREAQVNFAEAVVEEPNTQATLEQAPEGKPRSITPYPTWLMQLVITIPLLVH